MDRQHEAGQGRREGEALDGPAIDAIRFLSVGAVPKANSGHPGLPMGAAPMAFVLWQRFLQHNPANPAWFDRDRFLLSAGHGSLLLQSLLHLSGDAVSLDDLRQYSWRGLTGVGKIGRIGGTKSLGGES